MDVLDRVGDRPFFVFLHLYDPHWHYDPPDWARRLFETAYAGSVTGNWQDFSRRDRAAVSDADLAHLLALYDGEIRYADTEVGRVLDHLAARGLDRSTLVVITSDHGEEFLEHGSWEHQKTLYEEVVRVPLAIRGPGLDAAPRAGPGQPAGRRADDPGLGGRARAGLRHRPLAAGPAPRARGLRRDRPHRGRHAQALPARRAPRAGRRSSPSPRTEKRRAGRNGTIFPPIQPSARASPRSHCGRSHPAAGARTMAGGSRRWRSGTAGLPQSRATREAARTRLRERRKRRGLPRLLRGDRLRHFAPALVAAALLAATLAAPLRAEDVTEPRTGVKFPGQDRRDDPPRRGPADQDVPQGQGLRRRPLRRRLPPWPGPLKDKTGPALYQELVWGDFPKEIHLRLVRDVSASQMQEAIRDALEKADKARTDQFVSYFGDIKTGEEYVLRWAAGGTLETIAKGTPKPPIADKNFAAAVFGIWLGDEPVQDDIKRDLVARVPPTVK